MRLGMTMAAVAAAMAAAGCNSLLKGSKCNEDGTCGGGLVCDPASLTCVDSLAASADTGSAASDAGEVLDGRDATGPGPDAEGVEPPDAAEPGLDAASSSPTRECDAGWCQARISNYAGTWPQFNSVSGIFSDYYATWEIWVGGDGPTALKWNQKRWQDWSEQLKSESAAADYPISQVNFVAVDSSYLFWGGATALEGGAASCGWSSIGSDTPSFSWQSYCSGSVDYGTGWLGGFQHSTGTLVLVGRGGRLYSYSPANNLTDTSATDFRAVHFFDPDETWRVGAGGQVRFGPLDTTASADAHAAKGFPATTADLYAVQVFPGDPGALFVGGEGTLYECARSGEVGTIDAPILANCENALDSHPNWTIRAFASQSATDIWAVGVDRSSGTPKALLLVRTAKNAWADKTPVEAAGPLFGIWRHQDLTVVVGANGTLLSRIGPP